MAKQNTAPDFLGIAEKLKEDMRRYAKVYCLQWFDDSFQNEGFTDASYVAWEPRNPDREPGRAILTDTTFLRKSLHVMNEDESTITFGTHVPYAAVHNFGLRVRAVQNVRSHHRTNQITGERHQVKAHSRKIDTQYPKRQFMGESKQMMDNMDDWLITQIIQRFNAK